MVIRKLDVYINDKFIEQAVGHVGPVENQIWTSCAACIGADTICPRALHEQPPRAFSLDVVIH